MKSLYLVFGLQAVLAWLVALPVVASLQSRAPWHWLDAIGIAMFALGLGDRDGGRRPARALQGRPDNRGRVMARGLWRYSRHPNYFGEFCVWWGRVARARSQRRMVDVVCPLLMTVLLLKVSGVTLLEKTSPSAVPRTELMPRAPTPSFPWRPHP
jgi:steroid 5-alpha reductase family enzyme